MLLAGTNPANGGVPNWNAKRITIMRMVLGAREFPVARLVDAFESRMCVSAWLGYGDALFLGFGDKVFPPTRRHERCAKPPFELQTNFADWRVEAAGTAHMLRAAHSLVGEGVMDWQLLERNGLRLAFTGAKVLTVSPWNAAEGISDAWCITSPDNRILAVATDGRVVIVDATQPVRDWFEA